MAIILYRGMWTRIGNQINKRIETRRDHKWQSPIVTLNGQNGYSTTGVSTSRDPAVAFVYGCTARGAQQHDTAIYAIYVKQGQFYRGKNVHEQAGIIPGQAVSDNIQEQSIINNQEVVLQSVSSRQILGWFTIIANQGPDNQPVYRLGEWVPQPHWKMFGFPQELLNQARGNIHFVVTQRFPNGLPHDELANSSHLLTQPDPGEQFNILNAAIQ